MGDAYRYTDAQGVEHLTEDLSEVPVGVKAHKLAADLQVQNPGAVTMLRDQAESALGGRLEGEWLGTMHVPSAVGGGALVLAIFGLFWLRRTGFGRMARTLLSGAVLLAALTGYLTWSRRASGQKGSGNVIEDARAASQALEKRLLEERRAAEQAAH